MKALGLALVAGLLGLALAAHWHYGQFLDLVGSVAPGPLRDWLGDLRWPVYGVAAALFLTGVENLWQRLRRH